MPTLRYGLFIALLLAPLLSTAIGQTEATGWASLRGIRVDGEMMEFATSIRIVTPDGNTAAITANERVQQPVFRRDSETKQTQSGRLSVAGTQGISFTQTTEDTARGVAKIDLTLTANANVDLEGIYFVITLPSADYANAPAQLLDTPNSTRLATTRPGERNSYLTGISRGIKVSGTRRQIEVSFDEPKTILVQDDRRAGNGGINLRTTLSNGAVTQGQQIRAIITIAATGDINRNPIKLTIDPSRPGEPFVGVGGNFRLQNPTDPAVIQYNLDNLRVAWGRVAMPLNQWQPDENADPVAAAKAGQLNQNVRAAMEMARTLKEKKMPLVASAWVGPNWALGGTPPGRGRGAAAPGIGVQRGRPILPEKLEAFGKSIASYLTYMKENYAAEADYFSFNESDLGIDIRQTGAEHALMIKTFGKIFASAGLKTKLLLGDTSDATPFDFIKPAMADAEAIPYIGAVSFHSWRGGSDDTLSRWGVAARTLKVPLIVGEGGTDAAAYSYRPIFLEPWFALDEIDLYVRICNLAQPLSILEWQLTDDYSILTGGRNNQPLAPTQRFFQLKQLAATPIGARWIPITTDQPNIHVAAFGDAEHGYAIHLVNNGPARRTTLSGLPASVKQLKTYLTNSKLSMQESATLNVSGSSVQLELQPQTFTTLLALP